MTEQIQATPNRDRKGWRFLLFLVSLFLSLGGFLGFLFVIRERKSAGSLGLIPLLDASALTFAIGIIGLLRFGFWSAIAKRPVVRGGLIAALLLSFVFLISPNGVILPALFLLMIPIGGFAAANAHFRQSLDNVSLRLAAKIGIRSGLVASSVVFVLTPPFHFVRKSLIDSRLHSPLKFSDWIGSEILLILVFSTLTVGLTSLGGLVRGMTYQHTKKSV